MRALRRGFIENNDSNRKWYDREGYHMTGETLTLGDENENCT